MNLGIDNTKFEAGRLVDMVLSPGYTLGSAISVGLIDSMVLEGIDLTGSLAALGTSIPYGFLLAFVFLVLAGLYGGYTHHEQEDHIRYLVMFGVAIMFAVAFIPAITSLVVGNTVIGVTVLAVQGGTFGAVAYLSQE